MIRWRTAEMVGYTPITTFWTDFSIADVYGHDGIIDTYNRAFNEWKDNYKYLTELDMVLNHKIFQWNELKDDRAKLYNELWRQNHRYALDNLKGDELSYFLETTD